MDVSELEGLKLPRVPKEKNSCKMVCFNFQSVNVRKIGFICLGLILSCISFSQRFSQGDSVAIKKTFNFWRPWNERCSLISFSSAGRLLLQYSHGSILPLHVPHPSRSHHRFCPPRPVHS